jgi:hypothetical protein
VQVRKKDLRDILVREKDNGILMEEENSNQMKDSGRITLKSTSIMTII